MHSNPWKIVTVVSALLLGWAPRGHASPIIVDNPAAFGHWCYRTDDPNAYGNNYLQNPADAIKGGIFPWLGVGYTFVPDEDVDHVVSCRAPKSANSAPAVTVCVYHTRDGGPTLVHWGPVGVWDQTQLGNQWIEIGLVADVQAGDSVQIKILAAGTEGYVVNADAVMLCEIPEPATLGLLGLGSLALLRKRRER